MRRRQALIAMGAALGLAGCTSDGPGTAEPADRENPDGGTETVTRTATRIPIRNCIEISRSALNSPSDGWATVEFENPTGQSCGDFTAQIRYYDESGSLLETSSAGVWYLPAGTTYREFLYEPDGAADIEVEIAETGRLDYGSPDVGEITSWDMTEGEPLDVTVTGEVALNQDVDRLEVIAGLYDADDYLRGTPWDVGTSLPAGESWRFEISSSSRSPDSTPPITDAALALNGY